MGEPEHQQLMEMRTEINGGSEEPGVQVNYTFLYPGDSG